MDALRRTLLGSNKESTMFKLNPNSGVLGTLLLSLSLLILPVGHISNNELMNAATAVHAVETTLVKESPNRFNVTTLVNVVYKLEVDIDQDGTADGHGSCVLYSLVCESDNGIEVTYTYRVLTCAHVIPKAKARLNVVIPIEHNGMWDENKTISFGAQILKVNRDMDVAVVEFMANIRLYPATLSVAPLKSYDRVYSIGYPAGVFLILSDGRIMYRMEGHVVCTASAYFGNSGGGVFSSTTSQLLGLSAMIFPGAGDGFSRQELTYMHAFVPTEIIIPWLMSERLLTN